MTKGSASFGVELSDPVGQVIYRYLNISCNIYGPFSGLYLIWVAGYKLPDTGYWSKIPSLAGILVVRCSLLAASIGRIVIEN